MNRRTFLERLALAGGLAVCSPWQIAKMMGSNNVPSAMQRLLDWGPYDADAAALPQNFEIISPVEVAFRDATTLEANSGSAGRSVSTSTSIARAGMGTSTIAASPGQASGNVRIDQSGTWSWNNHAYIAVLLYVADKANLTNITVYVSSQASVTTKFFSFQQAAAGLINGWNILYKHRQALTVNGGEVFTDPIRNVMVRCDSNGSGDVTVNWDSVWFLGQHRPKHLWWFDDGFDGVYTIAYPYMLARGLKGNLAICRDLIGGANYMTLAQVQEIYASGWSVVNHTTNHTNLTTVSTAQELIDIITPNAEWLRSTVGVTDGGHWFVPPQGGMNALADSVVADLGYTNVRLAASTENTLYTSMFGSVQNPLKTGIPARATDVGLPVATWRSELNLNASYGATYHSYNHRPVSSGAVGTQVNEADLQLVADDCYRSPAFDTMTCLEWERQLTGRRSR